MPLYRVGRATRQRPQSQDVCAGLSDMKKPPSARLLGPFKTRFQEVRIPTDSFALIAIGLVALAAFWLVFSLVRKMFGLVLLVALAIGAWVLWSNPGFIHAATDALAGFVGSP